LSYFHHGTCISTLGKSRGEIKYTILSETYGSHCWDPLLPSIDLDDDNFSSWCKGAPCRPLTLMRQLMLPENVSDIKQTQYLIKSKNYFRPDTHLDLLKFSATIRQFVLRKLSGKNFSDLKFDYLVNKPKFQAGDIRNILTKENIEEAKNRFSSYLSSLNVDGELIESVVNKWNETDLEELGLPTDDNREEDTTVKSDGSSLYGSEQWDINEESAREMRDMFETQDVDMSTMEKWGDETYRSNTMQVESFLSSFLDVLRDMPNSETTFQSLKNDNEDPTVEVSGPGGVILSVCLNFGKYLPAFNTVNEDLLDIESQSDYLSVTEARGELPKRIPDITTEIAQIEAISPTLHGPLRSTMLRRLNRLKSEKKWLEGLKDIHSSGSSLSKFNKNAIIHSIYNSSVENGVYNLPVSHPSSETIVEFLLSYASDKLKSVNEMGLISTSEWESMRNGLWLSSLSSECLMAMSFLFNSNITLVIDGEEVFDYGRAYFNNDLIIKLSTDIDASKDVPTEHIS